MSHKETLRPGSPPRHRILSVEPLEDRRLLTTTYTPSPLVQNDYGTYVNEVMDIELRSRATPSEFLALRDDARAISAATATTTLDPAAAVVRANSVSVLLDRAALDGWMGPTDWAIVQARLTSNLDALGASQPLIEQTFADMQALAVSARVTTSEYQTFTDDFNQLRADETVPGATTYGYPDPQLYFAQHLGGFFRGWALNRTSGESQLRSDVRSIPEASGASAAGSAVVRRDVQWLQSLGAKLPSGSDAFLIQTYDAAFEQGAPSGQDVSTLESGLVAALGVTATRARVAQADRLASDAPAFFKAVGSSPTNVQTITTDVADVVNAGAGSALNPFKVTVETGLGKPRGG